MIGEQIIENSTRKKAAEPELVEVGPRFVLVPIRIFSGSFGGETLYKNGSYISPNKVCCFVACVCSVVGWFVGCFHSISLFFFFSPFV